MLLLIIFQIYSALIITKIYVEYNPRKVCGRFGIRYLAQNKKKHYKTQKPPRFKSLHADWPAQGPILWQGHVSQSEHLSVMATVWVKTVSKLTALSVLFLLLLCLPPGGGQKKKEVTLRLFQFILWANIVFLFMKDVDRLDLPVCTKLVTTNRKWLQAQICLPCFRNNCL